MKRLRGRGVVVEEEEVVEVRKEGVKEEERESFEVFLGWKLMVGTREDGVCWWE